MTNTGKVSGLVIIAAIVFGTALLFTGCDSLFGNNKESGGSSESGFTSIEAFYAWVEKQPQNTPDTAYRVKLNIKDNKLDWLKWGGGKYVNLDLSDSTITSIGDGAFSYTGLISIIIGKNVTRIGTGAFDQCCYLTSVIIPDSVTSINKQTFAGCTSLTGVTIGSGVTSIEYAAFVSTGLTSVTIGRNVTKIGQSAFQNCDSLKSVIIPNSVTIIDGGAFANTGLTSVIIPNSVTDIGYGAFDSCTSLASVTFQGTIASSNFADFGYGSNSFPGDLRAKFYETDSENGTPGTYTRPNGSNTWTKQ